MKRTLYDIYYFLESCYLRDRQKWAYFTYLIHSSDAARALGGHDSDQCRRGQLNTLVYMDNRALSDSDQLVAALAATSSDKTPNGVEVVFLCFDHFADCRTPWTSDQIVARPLPEHMTTQT